MTSEKVLEETKTVKQRAIRKPPPQQWKPGQSGNPNGRPKLSDSLADQVRSMLREPESKASKRTNMQVILATAVAQAKKGDYRAREFLANRGFGMAEQRIKQDVTKTEVIVLE